MVRPFGRNENGPASPAAPSKGETSRPCSALRLARLLIPLLILSERLKESCRIFHNLLDKDRDATDKIESHDGLAADNQPFSVGSFSHFFSRSPIMKLFLAGKNPPRLHADRVAGRDRHHRHPDRPALAGRAEGPRGRRPHGGHNNLKQIGLAIQDCHDANGRLPDAGSSTATTAGAGPATQTGAWTFQILPYMEQTAIFNWAANWNTTPVKGFMSPGRGRTSIATNSDSTSNPVAQTADGLRAQRLPVPDQQPEFVQSDELGQGTGDAGEHHGRHLEHRRRRRKGPCQSTAIPSNTENEWDDAAFNSQGGAMRENTTVMQDLPVSVGVSTTAGSLPPATPRTTVGRTLRQRRPLRFLRRQRPLHRPRHQPRRQRRHRRHHDA